MKLKSTTKKKVFEVYKKYFHDKNNNNAVLVLDDGSVYYGTGFGKPGIRVGEICFNTSMTGYQEIITDPSYESQIIIFTFPHIGIVGTNKEDYESLKSYVSGIVIREPLSKSYNWRSNESLNMWVKGLKIPGISGIDTRSLTKKIRSDGHPKGVISYQPSKKFNLTKLKDLAKNWSGLQGLDLVPKVTSKISYKWEERYKNIFDKYKNVNEKQSLHIVAIDYGIKHNILRNLSDLGCTITVVPSKISSSEILRLKPDGIFLSNGPGDPKATALYSSKTLLPLIDSNIPIFGICIGHQLLAIALGAKTEKMIQGHRGANHPVLRIKTNKVEITSQNHGFKVLEKNLPKVLTITHKSLFDDSIEGFEHKTKPIFSVQYHPEASPGPHDSSYLFSNFLKLIKIHFRNKKAYAKT